MKETTPRVFSGAGSLLCDYTLSCIQSLTAFTA